MQDVLNRFEGPLLKYATSFLGDSDRAQDVVQDTFIKLWKQDREAIESRLAPWLFTVCRNAALDVLKKDKRMKPLAAPEGRLVSDRKSPDMLTEHKEEKRRVLSFLEKLPDRQRELLRLKFQSGLRYQEISDVTGLSVSNVGYLIHTAMKTLRQQMQAEA